MTSFFKIIVDPVVSKKRFDVCKSCDRLSFNFCKECKCFMPAKTKLISAKCPLDKWQENYFSEEW